ncbi:MAG TPA: methyltransferase domain-containing protein, partial [Myxococcota bacterium]
MAERDAWDPAQYDRFRRERQQPFFDLLDLVEPVVDGRAVESVVDLGCGTGDTTRLLHERLRARSTTGIDSSPTMLQAARDLEQKQGSVAGLRFTLAHVENTHDWATPSARFDVLFSNACLQWIPGHVPLFAQLAERLSSTGQLAVQMPVNNDHA